MNDPIAALRRQLEQLRERHARGQLDAAAYEREKGRLERELLDRVLAHDAPAAGATPAGPRPSLQLVALLAVAVVALAVVGYAGTGSPSLIFGPPPQADAGAGSPHELSGEQFAAAVDKLARKLEAEPGNFEGWAMLGRSYMQLERFADASRAYAKAVALDGNDARVLVDYADALAVANNRKLEGEPMKLVERALALEPDNQKALALAGSAAFNRQDYKGAVRWWERLAAVAPADSPFRRQLQGSIDEARQRGGLPPAAMPAGPPAGADAGAPPPPAAGGGGGVTGTVRLAPALAAQARPDDTVFVLARPAEGSRMPLAIVRKQVRDLPFEFALTDAMAMAPNARMSLFPKIVIDARVSKSGQAQPSAGDLAGHSGTVANDAAGVVVEINERVKN